MDQQRIKALIDLMAASDLVELKFSENDCTLELLRETSLSGEREPAVPDATALSASSAPFPQVSDSHTQCAPFYGVLHLTPAPGKPPFVQAGDRVEKGQTLGLLEAMKMFHPLEAECSGRLQAILVNAGEDVDAEQPLFRIANADDAAGGE
ncbi:hypothetical protein NG99_13170 [Erwinia typographi]|uniref:Biotin carboxyl carrier protein of acetyl-CoA carboxylase n=1 Tax=Erwinia typographi TaxID=371042 RepID=A0A0A4A4S6_9GAMM|nr:acetyl-CoA carboxylase biotin carboxyl carrier protein subunit [Erwinia typographi]KGT92883.1 hypothetical protein NG99_13170 [Erwinia typographi]